MTRSRFPLTTHVNYRSGLFTLLRRPNSSFCLYNRITIQLTTFLHPSLTKCRNRNFKGSKRTIASGTTCTMTIKRNGLSGIPRHPYRNVTTSLRVSFLSLYHTCSTYRLANCQQFFYSSYFRVFLLFGSFF